MDHRNYIVKPIDYPEFIAHIYSQSILNKMMARSQDGVLYRYPVKASIFYVWDSSNVKITTNLDDYNSAFSKITGETFTYGKTEKDDVKQCDLGPEILDLEISVNGCPKVGGHNCKFCYKNNTDAEPVNMPFQTFRRIIDSFPRNMISVAFGITGVQTNPDFPAMLQYCRESGIIPNYTLSGADLNDYMIDITRQYCGAVAVSCYEGNKDLCYNTIAKFAEKAPNVHVNMHIVLSNGTLNHVMDVLHDLAKTKSVERETRIGKYVFKGCYKVPEDPRLEHLSHIVFLRIKPVGRAQKLDTSLSLETYKKIIDFCNENSIGFGFDSCSAKDVESVYRNMNQPEMATYCQPCEGSLLSAYINVSGMYWHCSFAERDQRITSINTLDYDNAIDWWTSDTMNQMRKKFCSGDGHCPLFKLTVD